MYTACTHFISTRRTSIWRIFVGRYLLISGVSHSQNKYCDNFTFMLLCVLTDFFLITNQTH